MRVKRKNGKEEEFMTEKIVVAIVKAGGKAEVARSIAKEVENALAKSPVVTSKQIRTEVLNRLKTKDMRTYESWIAYDEENNRM